MRPKFVSFVFGMNIFTYRVCSVYFHMFKFLVNTGGGLLIYLFYVSDGI